FSSRRRHTSSKRDWSSDVCSSDLFGSGATMILGLTFIGLRASSAHQAAALSGMAQSVGYLLAACGPPLMGKIHDANGDWSVPLMGVAILSLLMAIFGLCAGRDKEIR